jgi:hypothetical protein
MSSGAQLAQSTVVEDHRRTSVVGRAMNLVTLALASLVAVIPSAADADCPSVTGLAPAIASPSGFDLPKDGGVVVGAFGADVPLPTGDPAVQTGWRIRTDAGAETPRLVTLAPGLVVYRSSARSGRIALENDRGESIAWVIATARKQPVLAAPDPTTAEVVFAGGTVRIGVELATKAPKEAIALVLADSKGTPRSWSLVHRGSTQQNAYAQNRCQVVPNGSVLSQAGEKVTFLWVDQAGRVSPASKPIALGGKPVIPGVP